MVNGVVQPRRRAGKNRPRRRGVTDARDLSTLRRPYHLSFCMLEAYRAIGAHFVWCCVL